METFLRRKFKVKGNISCIYKPGSSAQVVPTEKIEVQLWHQSPMQKIFLGKGPTDSSGEFAIEFEVDSPTAYIVDGKIENVFLEAYYAGVKISDSPSSSLQEGLVAYWKFDETEGTVLVDATGNNHNGALAGMVWPTHSIGKINNGINFHGTTAGTTESYVRVESSEDFNFGTGDFSFSFWLKADNVVPIDLINTDPGDDTFLVQFDIYSGVVLIQVEGSDIYFGVASVALDEWHHFVVRRAGSELEVIVDNVTLGTQSYSGILTCGASFFIAKNKYSNCTLNGFIDEFGVWKGRSLSNEDVSQLYNSGYGIQFPFTQVS